MRTCTFGIIPIFLLIAPSVIAGPLTTNGWAWNTQFSVNTCPDFYYLAVGPLKIQSWKCGSHLNVYNSRQNNSQYSCKGGKTRIDAISEMPKYSGECVSFVKLMSGTTNRGTGSWKKGEQVTPDSRLAPNTIIATFTNNRYNHGHTAVYLFHTQGGIVVLDQNWSRDGTVAMHIIPFGPKNGTTVSNAYAYNVVFWCSKLLLFYCFYITNQGYISLILFKYHNMTSIFLTLSLLITAVFMPNGNNFWEHFTWNQIKKQSVHTNENTQIDQQKTPSKNISPSQQKQHIQLVWNLFTNENGICIRGDYEDRSLQYKNINGKIIAINSAISRIFFGTDEEFNNIVAFLSKIPNRNCEDFYIRFFHIYEWKATMQLVDLVDMQEKIFINGKLQFQFPVEYKWYRLNIVNDINDNGTIRVIYGGDEMEMMSTPEIHDVVGIYATDGTKIIDFRRDINKDYDVMIQEYFKKHKK